MNNQENSFEEFLRSKLENHTVEVSDSVWAGIEKKQKKRGVLIWFKHYLNVFIALDIAFVLGFSAISMLNSGEVQSQNKIYKSAKTVPSIAQNTSLNEVKEVAQKENKQTVEAAIPSAVAAGKSKNETPKIKASETNNLTKAVTESSKTKTALTAPKLNKEESILSQSTVHQQILNTTERPLLYALSNLSPMDLETMTNENHSNYVLNTNLENVSALPPSIMQSKSKKVLKAEQKVVLKEQKAIAKQAEQVKLQAEKENEKAAVEAAKMNQEMLSQATLVSGSSEEAPLAFDTVYGKKKFKGYIAIDALISPDLAFRSLKSSNDLTQNFIAKRDSAEKMRLAYSALMRVNLFITKNIFINTGISFSQRKEKFSIEHKWQTHEDRIDSSKFVTYVDPFEGNTIYKTYDTLDYVTTYKESINHQVVMSFLDVPLMLGYKWLGKRTGIAVQGGVIWNLLFKQKGTIADYNYTSNDVTKNNQNPFTTSAGLSIAGAITSNIKLNDKLDLLIEPHTRYVLKAITVSDYPVQQKIFSYGLNVGLRLKL